MSDKTTIACAECGKSMLANQINGDPDHDLCLCDDCADEIIARQEALTDER